MEKLKDYKNIKKALKEDVRILKRAIKHDNVPLFENIAIIKTTISSLKLKVDKMNEIRRVIDGIKPLKVVELNDEISIKDTV